MKIALTALAFATISGFGYLLTDDRKLRHIAAFLFGVFLGMTIVFIWINPEGGR